MSANCDNCGGQLIQTGVTPYDGTPEYECQTCGAEKIGGVME
jgi:hypothetical protein